MKIFRVALLGLLVLLFCTPALAADVVKLGFFDMQTIIDRSEMGKEGAEKFRVEKEQVRQELASKLEEVKALDDEFKKKEHIWSLDVKKTKAQEIMAKKMEYDRLTYEAKRKLGQQEQDLLMPIRDKVLEIVNRIGKEEGFSMIWEMRRAGLAYAPDTLGLTDRIIRELNESAAKQETKSP
ncbi:MAG: OmpH family outer membrane protein [Deltaproteobacteria bacterium]|nr:MAG: OmpH family outer membrane protein [Deltaproteobacteria bacterium]